MSGALHDVPHPAMVERYERLKRQYFQGTSYGSQNDSDAPTLIDRGAIIQMFEHMGVEIPLTPQDPIKLRPGRG